MRRRAMTAEDAAEELIFDAFEILPPFNVARKVERTLEVYGAEAATHAAMMATFARAYGQPDIAEDYDLVHKIILERQAQHRLTRLAP